MVYFILVLIHVIAVIIFLGNITIAPFWKANADKKKDRLLVLNVWEGIIRADKLFTMPGVVLLLIFGIGSALHGGFNLISTGWIFWSIILYIISGAAFMAKVVPIQKKIVSLASDEAIFNWDSYYKLTKQWDIWSSIATITPWIAVILMVIKPNI
ncbi:MAG: DUF2269 family protein [Ignavibacteriaceae bacterium]|nr:DUF2269 domain-containing protein [Ignavibacteria bacterium]NNL20704.1 DUF2269 family protein [Ignavibacteriaceae bacterium]